MLNAILDSNLVYTITCVALDTSSKNDFKKSLSGFLVEVQTESDQEIAIRNIVIGHGVHTLN